MIINLESAKSNQVRFLWGHSLPPVIIVLVNKTNINNEPSTVSWHLTSTCYVRKCFPIHYLPAGPSPTAWLDPPILQMRKLSGFPLVSQLVGGWSCDKNPALLPPSPPTVSGLFPTKPRELMQRNAVTPVQQKDYPVWCDGCLFSEGRAGKDSEMKYTHLKQFTLNIHSPILWWRAKVFSFEGESVDWSSMVFLAKPHLQGLGVTSFKESFANL